MTTTKTSWNESGVTAVIGADIPTFIRMNNEQAQTLYNELSIRAADHDLFNKGGTFTIGGLIYELSAGQWASIYRALKEWYKVYFDAFVADDLFASIPDANRVPALRRVK